MACIAQVRGFKGEPDKAWQTKFSFDDRSHDGFCRALRTCEAVAAGFQENYVTWSCKNGDEIVAEMAKHG